MIQTLPHILSAADSAQATAFARQIVELAHPADRLRIARYGMDLFQQFPISIDEDLEFIATLYMLDVPNLSEYLETIMVSDARVTAFEYAIALRVHLLCTKRPLPETAQLTPV